MKCRHCQTHLKHPFINLGFSPPSNAYLSSDDLDKPENTFPLKVYVCHKCWLVQTADFAEADELFTDDYAYFSSTSSSWLEHAKKYCDMITKRCDLNEQSFVVELAANDGYLLKNFVEKGIPCVGIEPTQSTAKAAEELNIPIEREFFGVEFAQDFISRHKKADLIIGNNVYAHVPDINDFTKAIALTLSDNGIVTLEFPHLLELIKHAQFDTIYHEHYSYLSVQSVQRIFKTYGLNIFDIEKLSTHGGSLRIYGCLETSDRPIEHSVQEILDEEEDFGLKSLEVYQSFQKRADNIKNDFISFLIEQKRAGLQVAGYGAAAKGNTLLNYAGIKPDLLSFICDAAQSKQGKYMPGSHIPILPPEALQENKPDVIIILPWNLKAEIAEHLSYVRNWNGECLTAIPSLEKVAS